jgi:hypothetical protein
MEPKVSYKFIKEINYADMTKHALLISYRRGIEHVYRIQPMQQHRLELQKDRYVLRVLFSPPEPHL